MRYNTRDTVFSALVFFIFTLYLKKEEKSAII